MTGSVYGSLATVNRLIVDASENAEGIDIPGWWFTCAADSVARAKLDDADEVLSKIEDGVDQQDVLTPIRDARQLVIALQEDWSI